MLPLRLTAAAAATDAAIQKKILWLDVKTLVFLNEDLSDIMKIVRFFE